MSERPVTEQTSMLVIGLAGGVASGKSLVASCFQHFGATLLDADRIGHDVLKDVDVVTAIKKQWAEVVSHDGEINRKALGRIVFDPVEGSDQLRVLEQITHPKIGVRIEKRLKELQSERIPAAILDAPVMFKADWDRMCDKIVYVDADVELRKQRAAERGWDDDEIALREARQTPLETKRSRSTDFIDNSGTKENTYNQAKALWKKWKLHFPRELDTPSTLFQPEQPT